MGKKKKKAQAELMGEQVQSDVKTEEGKSVEQMKALKPEVPEIKEIQVSSKVEPMGEAVSGKSSKGASAGRVFFSILLLTAMAVLAVFLWKTMTELHEVKTASSVLETELKKTEDKLAELSLAVNETKECLQETEDKVQVPEADTTPVPRPTLPPERYTVCVDAGHGAHDTGAVLELEDGTSRMEKDDNLRMAKLVQAELEALGIQVIMTRDDDSFLELYDRTLMANGMDVDALISLHRNAYYLNGKMNDRVSGVEIWIHSSRPTSARQLANDMLDAILEIGGMKDRGVRYGSMTDFEEDYAINRRSLMPSMIIEFGFISNEEDNEALDANGEAYAKAIAEEVYDWLLKQESSYEKVLQ